MSIELKKSKIFIAGHQGMVGKAVLDYLKKKKLNNLIFLSKKKLNLQDKNKVNNFFKKNKPDIVINCAAKVGGINSNNNNKISFLQDNLEINQNIFRACHNFKVSKMIFLGSSCIYPKNIKILIKEEDLLSSYLEETNEAYALAKIVGIKLCDFYNKKFNTDYRAIMPCNLFGPNDKYDLENSHALPALIKKIHLAKKRNEEYINIWGNGKPKREFLFVNDLAEYIYKILLIKKKDFQKISYKSFINIGSKYEYKIVDLVKIISKALHHPVKVKYIKKNLNGTIRKKLNDFRFRKIIKNKRQTPFIESIKTTYNDFLGG